MKLLLTCAALVGLVAFGLGSVAKASTEQQGAQVRKGIDPRTACVLCEGAGVWTGVACPGCDGTGTWGQRAGGTPAQAVQKAIELKPSGDAQSYVNRGLERKKGGDYDGAIADFSKAIELDPRSAFAYAERGAARRKKGDLDGALADASRAIEIDPKEAFAYAERGAVKRMKGDLDGAITDTSKAIEIDPREDFAYSQRGMALRAKLDRDGALADLSKAIELRPGGDPQLYVNYLERASLRSLKGDRTGAIADYAKAIELNPQHENVFLTYTLRGATRMAAGDLDGAIADYSKSLELKPGQGSVYFTRGIARRDQGDLDGAIVDITKGIENGYFEYVQRGLTKSLKDDLEGAIADYTMAIERYPKHWRAYYERGCLRYNQQSWPNALADFRKILEASDPYAGAAILRIWAIRARLGERDGATQELAQYLKDRSWGKPNDWFSRSALFFCDKLPEADFFASADEKAAQSSKVAKVESTRMGEAFFVAGTRRLIDGNQEKAREYFQKCLKFVSKTSTSYLTAQAELKALDAGRPIVKAPDERTKDSGTYTNKELQIAFAVPENWTIRTSAFKFLAGDGTLAEFDSEDQRISGLLYHRAADMKVEDYADAAEGYHRKLKAVSKYERVREERLTNKKTGEWLLREYEQVYDGSDYHRVDVFIRHGKNNFHVGIWCSTTLWGDCKGAIYKTIEKLACGEDAGSKK